MKKFILKPLSYCIIMLLLFFTNNLAFGEEESSFDSIDKPANVKSYIENQMKKNQKKSFFDKFKDKFKSKKEKEDEAKGYYGTLPDIKSDFAYKNPPAIKVNKPDGILPDEIAEDNLKKAPDDALFLDIIVKKEKASNYINDLQRTKRAIFNLKTCIEEGADIQRFNGCVNLIDLYVKNLKTKYENTSDSLRKSYSEVLALNYYAKVLGNLKYDANYYARYIPTDSGKYSKSNIYLEEQKLLNQINRTLFSIGEET